MWYKHLVLKRFTKHLISLNRDHLPSVKDRDFREFFLRRRRAEETQL